MNIDADEVFQINYEQARGYVLNNSNNADLIAQDVSDVLFCSK